MDGAMGMGPQHKPVVPNATTGAWATSKIHPVDHHDAVPADSSKPAPVHASTSGHKSTHATPHEPVDPPPAHRGLAALTLRAPHWVLVLLWWYLLLYQLANATMLGSLAFLYASASSRDSILFFVRVYFLFSSAARFLDEVSPFVCVAYFFFAAFFFYGASSMIYYSIAGRRWSYGMMINLRPRAAAPAHSNVKRTRLGKVVAVLRGSMRVWESFGVRGRYFASGLIVREGMEALLQTVQAESSAKRVSNPAVNTVYAILIFINCCSSYLFGYVFRADQAHRRLACVLTDLLLDFIWGTVLPVLMFMPYVRLYLSRNDPDSDVAWSDNAQPELEQMLVLSLKAFILSIFPFVSSLGNIRGVKRLLSQAKPPARRGHENHTDHDAAPTTTPVEPIKPKPAPAKPPRGRRASGRAIWSRVVMALPWNHALHSLMVLHGIIILTISIVSSGVLTTHVETPYDCMRRVHPWLSTKEACAGRRINCTSAGIQGSKDEIMAALELFDEATLATLEIVDCPALQLPPSIHRFHDLLTLTITNCAITEWGSDAALTEEHFYSIQTLRLNEIDLQTDPTGLYREPLAASFEWFAFYEIDVTSFIDNVGSNWEALKFIYLDSVYIERVPSVVATMPNLLELSITWNPISELSAEVMGSLTQLTSLWMYGCPLNELPDEAWQLSSHLVELAIQYTNVSTYPVWLNDIVNPELAIDAFASPLCDENSTAYAIATMKQLTCVDNV